MSGTVASLPVCTTIVPLYQYPLTADSWKPLHTVISSFPKHKFIIIVNPNSGPGVDPDGWLPDAHYSREIPRLTAQENVLIVGYVRLDYCRRPLVEVEKDLEKYSNWSGVISNANRVARHSRFTQEISTPSELVNYSGNLELGVHGIFFDETPNLYSDEAARYLDAVIHNPGTVPDPEYVHFWQQLSQKSSRSWKLNFAAVGTTNVEDIHINTGAPDVTVVFEESYALWLSEAQRARMDRLLRYRKENCCYMVHSVPYDMVRDLVRELRGCGRYIFVTSLSEKYYEAFGDSWEDLAQIMAE